MKAVWDQTAKKFDFSASHVGSVPEDLWTKYKDAKVVNLSSNKLRTLPDQLSKLTNVEELYLDHNRFDHFPRVISQMKSLKILHLGYNVIKSIPVEISNLQQLENLNLECNAFTAFPKEICALTKVHSLRLGFGRRLNVLECGILSVTEVVEIEKIPENLTKMPLVNLHISHCKMKVFPSILFGISSLENLSLESCSISSFPSRLPTSCKLQEISLARNELQEIPPALFAVQTLTKVDMKRNKISDIPEEIRDSKKLKNLSLQWNKISSLPSGLGELVELQECDLSHNRLKRLPSIIGRLKKLKMMNLSDNMIDEIPSSFGELSALRELNLQDLDLSHNQLANIPDSICVAPALRTLNLRGNKIAEVPENIRLLQQLHELNLSQNQIGFIRRELCSLKELQQLDLRSNKIVMLPGNLGELEKLQVLLLSNRDLTGDKNRLSELPDSICKLQRLQSLDVSGNKLTTLPIGVQELKCLHTVDFSDNPFCNGTTLQCHKSRETAQELVKVILLNVSHTFERYSMSNKPRGLAVIINNQHFKGLPERVGTEHDERRLVELFRKLHFTVEVHRDLSIHEIDDVMRDVSRRKDKNNRSIHEKHDCLVVCIMSHGVGDKICGSDDQGVEMRDLTRWFTASRCLSLAGKPKIFFIQACKGNEYMTGVTPDEARPVDAITVPKLTPDEGDFLIGLSTVPDYVSYRTPTGSWYIQTLVDLMETHASNESLPAILERVSKQVGEKMTSDIARSARTQMPSHFSTLRKKLFLTY